MSFEAALAMLQEDARAINARMAGFRDRPLKAPLPRGYFKPGSQPARMYAAMVPGRVYRTRDAAALLQVPSETAGSVMRRLVESGHVAVTRTGNVNSYVRPE